MDSLIGVIIPVYILAHALLLIYIAVRRGQLRGGGPWLGGVVTLALLANAAYLLPVPEPGVVRREFVVAVALAALLIAYGALLLHDVLDRWVRLWAITGLIWLVALIVVGALADEFRLGQPEWLVQVLTAPDPLSALLLTGLAVSGALFVAAAFYGFYIARLPEVANRALFWVLNSAGLTLSILLATSLTDVWFIVGMLLLFICLVGATYAAVSYRVVDIRTGLLAGLRMTLTLALLSLIVFGALQVFADVRAGDGPDGLSVAAVIAVMGALLFLTLRVGASVLISPLRNRAGSPTEAARRYSQQVSRTVELERLIEVVPQTLNSVMGVRRSGMVLVNDTSSSASQVEVLVMRSADMSAVEELKGFLVKEGPLYQRLAVEQMPVSQFDMDYAPAFRALSAGEVRFFRGLQMSAYAPIVVENVLIGVLMCGPKINDAPFHGRDLELLATMADQTGVALRNVRLVADLRHLNASMKALNAGLEEANEQMEKLDSVKTDFVTIASHELRTPLAQIRGYTDIIDALNDQGMLDKDQISGMVANLRKATERTEELISAMLDVSQLDVNAMDLRLTQSAPESIMRMAIEPLTDALNQRKLSLSARGLRGLPTIQADMQRLVQAFRNVIVNAIKFTPDGGRIDITASLQPAEDPSEDQKILIAISDTGVGIDQENLELIFEKFFRAYDPGLHSTGTYKFLGAGPGLGLTIARGVIEGHGGKIWAESSGHNMETFPGTTFYILLPVSPPEDARRVLPFEEGSSDVTLMRS